MADLYPYKMAKSVLNLQRTVHKRIPGSGPAWDCLDEGLRLLYNQFGTSHYIGRLNIPFTLDDLEGMPLGTSAGLNKPETTPGRVRPPVIHLDDCDIKVSASKKYETLPTDLKSLVAWLLDADAPDLSVMWNTVPKNENFIDFIKQMSIPEWDLLMQKLRLYVIPSSIFVLMERLVSRVRFRLERGRIIQIGHSHSRGGADRLAERLRVNFNNEMLKIIVEGDIKNFDQSVMEEFIDLYFSHGLVYDKPGTPEYTVRLRITKFLIRSVLCRLTHLFGSVWGIQTGGVPSGILNTSHLDSWVMALWFFMFGVYQVKIAPDCDKEMLEEALVDMVALIVYGDDHLWNKTSDPKIAPYFSGYAFARFMKRYFDVEVRGIKDGITFLSDTVMGMLSRIGATFLRHQFVLNAWRDSDDNPVPSMRRTGQCRYLPFRESREYFARCAWGKENRVRTELDIILSCIGHAYGTYNSNHYAWYGLKMIYSEAVKSLGLPEAETLRQVIGHATDDDFKEMRRKGVTREEILQGFPTEETLREKNIYDASYHEKIWGNLAVNAWDE